MVFEISCEGIVILNFDFVIVDVNNVLVKMVNLLLDDILLILYDKLFEWFLLLEIGNRV